MTGILKETLAAATKGAGRGPASARPRMSMAGLACAVLLLAGAVAAVAAPAATHAAAPGTLARRAAAAERDGRLRDAVAAYTALLEQDAAAEPVVAARLAELHVRLDEPGPALAWAARVARRHPEPAAFLAGVYARLGLFTDAEMALRQALREAPDAARRLPLMWQLAETQEQAGDSGAARETLRLAQRTAGDARQREATERRLETLRARQTIKAGPDPAPEQREEHP